MAAKKYSAGAIFLQVVPVFANVQRAIEAEAKNIDRALGDQMEKSGEKAGERAGRAASKTMADEIGKGKISEAMEREVRESVDGMNKALGGINTRNLGKRLREDVKEMRAELASLSDVDLQIDANVTKVTAKVAGLRAQIESMRKRSKIFFDTDGLPQVYRSIAELEQRVGRINGTVKIEADTRDGERKMGAFERAMKANMAKAAGHIRNSVNPEIRRLRDELDYLGKLRVGIDIGSTQIRREAAEIMAELEAISQNDVEIDAKFEAGLAFGEMAVFNAGLDKIDGRDVNVRVDVDSARAQADLHRLSGSSDQAANSFRSFSFVALAVAGVGPTLIPVLGAVAGGLLAIGPAAGVAAFGLGAVLVGFSGLGNAITALGNQQAQAGLVAQTAASSNVAAARSIQNAIEGVANAERNAARAAQDAARAVADAREQAADTIENALDRQKDAQKSYADSVDEVRDAEQALRDARAEAAGTGDSLDLDIRSNSLAIDQAMLDSFDATVQFDAVNADGSATNAEQEQARINREEALLRLEELRTQQRELAAEKKKWDKEGVNGTEEVESAQDSLNSALEAQRDAYQDLRDAAQEVDQARADGAEMVSDALRDQNRTLADNARSIQDAKDALADARQASLDSADALNTQQNAVDQAMNALGPAGRKFALFLFGMRDGFREFRDDIQAAMLPSIQRAIEGFIGSSNAGTVRAALVGLAAGFGDFVELLSVSLQGDAWGDFFEMLAKYGPDIQAAYGGAFISFLEAMASVMTTLAPFALQFAEGFEKMMDSFAGWAASSEGQAALTKFMNHLAEIAPDVLDAFGSLANAFVALAVALAPYGEMLLGILTGFLDFIAGMDPDLLQVIATSLFAVVLASQVAYGVIALTVSGANLLTSALGLFVFALVGVGLAIYWVYQQNETLGTILGVIAGIIFGVIAAVKIWTVLQLIWTAITGYAALATTGLGVALLSVTWPIVLLIAGIALLVAAIVWLWRNNETFRDIVKDVWEAIQDAFWAAWEVIKDVLRAIGDAFVWLWNNAIKPAWGFIMRALSAIGAAFTWLWKNAISPALRFIGAAFARVFRAMRAIWENVLWPVIRTIGRVVWNLYSAYFKIVLVAILALFKATMIGMQWVWEHILRPLFGLIGDAANWLWREALAPAFNGARIAWETMMDAMVWVWQNVLRPIFNVIADTALPALTGAFQLAVDAIEMIWDGLRRIVGVPIRFVIETIINDGLIAGFNQVADWVGMEGFDKITVPNFLQEFATGGVMPGYTPGKDVHSFVSPTGGRLNLSGGEAVMRPEFTRAVGPDWVDDMNGAAMSGGINGVKRLLYPSQAFARGGIVNPYPGSSRSTYAGHDGVDLNRDGDNGSDGISGGVYPYFSATSGNVTSTGYSRGYGNAVFVNSPFGELVYGHSFDGSIRVSPGQAVNPGTMLGIVGNTGNSSGAHLHFGFPNGSYEAALGVLNAAGAGGYDVAGAAVAAGGGPKLPGWIKSLLTNPLDTIKGWATSQFSKASDLVNSSPIFDFVKNVPGKLVGGLKDKVMDIVPGWAKSAAGLVGDAVGGIKDGLGNVGDGIGNGLDAIGLAKGGILPYNGTMKYDSGGYLPPGLTSVVNLTGKPEPVFTNDQWSDMEPGQGGSGNIHYEPHFEGSDLRSEDVAGDLNFTFRKIRRGGKYEGVGS